MLYYRSTVMVSDNLARPYNLLNLSAKEVLASTRLLLRCDDLTQIMITVYNIDGKKGHSRIAISINIKTTFCWNVWTVLHAHTQYSVIYLRKLLSDSDK